MICYQRVEGAVKLFAVPHSTRDLPYQKTTIQDRLAAKSRQSLALRRNTPPEESVPVHSGASMTRIKNSTDGTTPVKNIHLQLLGPALRSEKFMV